MTILSRRSQWFPLDPRAKLLMCVCYVISVAVVPNGRPLCLCLLAGLLILCHAAARARIGRAWIFALPVAALIPLGMVFGGRPAELIEVDCKILLCAFAVSRFNDLTPFTAILSALRAFGAPPLATTLMLLAHRYVETLTLEGKRTVQAFTFRPVARRRPIRQYAMLATSLVLRASDRSERIAIALEASRFNGELPVAPLPPLRRVDILSLVVALPLITIAVFGGR